MTNERINQAEEKNEERPFLKRISLLAGKQSAIVNNFLGIRFPDADHISFICDMRIPIRRKEMKNTVKGEAFAQIGILTITLNVGRRVFIGDEKLIQIKKTLSHPISSVIKIRSAEPISVEYVDGNVYQLKDLISRKTGIK